MKTELNFDAIRVIAADVWEDLGRTRLASVAIGLALALLAITVLIFRPAGSPEIATDSGYSATTPATATAAAEDEVSFTLPGQKPIKMADVDLSAPRDPFMSTDGSSPASVTGQTLIPVDEAVQQTIAETSSSWSGTSSGADTSSLMPIDDLSGGTPSPAPAPTDTSAGELQEEPEPREPASAPVTDYSYAADIEFGRVDDLKRYAQVQRLGLVPSRKLPLLMYLGVATDHETAVFMVDSRLSQGGEGKCVPKASLCTFLELRASADQDEHRFRDADGNEYLLRLRRLVRTTDGSGSLSGRSVSQLRGTPPVVDGTR